MGISIKGVIVGYLACLLSSLIMGIALGYTLAATVGPENARQLITPPSFPILMGSMITSTLGGYVAARVAGGGELLNGALAILLGGTVAAMLAGVDSSDAVIQTIIQIGVLPLFGLFGGYIRLRQVVERA